MHHLSDENTFRNGHSGFNFDRQSTGTVASDETNVTSATEVMDRGRESTATVVRPLTSIFSHNAL
jgi:hypothetical protein